MSEDVASTPKKIRKLRHWRQRYQKNARFCWRRNICYAGVQRVLGTPLTAEEVLAMGERKLRRLWQSQTIELLEFDENDPRSVPIDEELLELRRKQREEANADGRGESEHFEEELTAAKALLEPLAGDEETLEALLVGVVEMAAANEVPLGQVVAEMVANLTARNVFMELGVEGEPPNDETLEALMGAAIELAAAEGVTLEAAAVLVAADPLVVALAAGPNENGTEADKTPEAEAEASAEASEEEPTLEEKPKTEFRRPPGSTKGGNGKKDKKGGKGNRGKGGKGKS